MNLHFRIEEQIPTGRGPIPIPNTGQYECASRVECNVQNNMQSNAKENFYFTLGEAVHRSSNSGSKRVRQTGSLARC